MEAEIFDTLEEALSRINTGEDLESILSKHPKIESDLQLLLESLDAAHLISPADVPTKTINRSRTRILARTAQLRRDQNSSTTILRRIPRLVFALAIAVILTLMSFSGLSIVSAKALPGDQLYPLKRVAENIRLGMSVTLKDHQAVEDRYKARRIDEVNRLIAAGRTELIEFFGRVNQQGDNIWDIGGIEVRLSPDTILIGDILVGMMVEVEGVTVPDGWVQASEIHLQTYGFLGYIESISPGVWQISGKTVHITPESRVDSAVQVGDWVVVSVRSDDFGVLTALIIDTSTLPTPTPMPTLIPDSIPKTSVPTLTNASDEEGDGTADQGDAVGEDSQEIEDSPISDQGEPSGDDDSEDEGGGGSGDDGDSQDDDESYEGGDKPGDGDEKSGDDGDDSGEDDDKGDEDQEDDSEDEEDEEEDEEEKDGDEGEEEDKDDKGEKGRGRGD